MAVTKKVSVRQEVQAVGFYLGEDEYPVSEELLNELTKLI